MKFPRFFRHHHEGDQPAPSEPPPAAEHQVVEIDPDQLRALSNVFSAPKWLRDLGLASWLLAGVAILLVGVVWLLALTATITDPVVAGLVIAVVASPIVGRLERHRRSAGRGRRDRRCSRSSRSRSSSACSSSAGSRARRTRSRSQANSAAPKVQHWLRSLGVELERRDGRHGQRAERHACHDLDAHPRPRDGIPGSPRVAFFALVRGARDLLPAQGRAVDAVVGRRAPRRREAGRAADHGQRDAVASALLRRRHARRGVQRRDRRARRADPRRAARRHDRRRDVRHRLHPLHRRLRRGGLRGHPRARLAGHRHGDRHARDRPARERPPPEHLPADRLRRDAAPQPARRADRDDRRRVPLRHGRAHPRPRR